MRWLKRSLGLLGLLLIVLVIYAVAGFNLNALGVKAGLIRQAVLASPRPPVPVTTVTAAEEVWPAFIRAIGTVEAVKGVTIAPQVAGRVSAILFESGQFVRPGTPLVKLDSSIEEAELKEAQAQLNLAKLTLARAQELAERGNMSQANLDNARAQREAGQARVERISASIALKTLVAPFEGRLGIRQVNLGQYVAAGTGLVSLQSQDPIYVNFNVPERELPRLKIGQRVTARVDGLDADRFEGEITSIDAKIDQTTRNILIQAQFPNAAGKLVPGMFANLRVRLSEEAKLVVVPETAVSYSLYGDSVFVVVPAKDKDGKPVTLPDGTPALGFERRFVRVAERRSGAVGLSEGVAAGDIVITSGQIRLVPGVRVTIDNKVGLKPPAERSRP
jgi:membrane fusion protein (multidrug efflux system)